MDVDAAVARWIAEHALPPERAPVVVACSGGADSTALLLALAAWGRAPLTAVYVDHGLREGTDAEARSVATIAASVGARFEATRVSVARRGNLLGQAREARYRALVDAAVRSGASCIAVGHTATDQAETLVMRASRGDVSHALAGMPAVRTLGASGVSLIRPLLEVTRAETAAWVALHGIAPVVDPSNASLRFARVRARRDLGAHEGLDRRLAGFAARAADHVERLDEAAAALGPLDGIDASRVASAGADVALRLLRRAGVHRAGHRHQEALLRLVANMSGTQHLDLGDGVWAERVYGRLSFGRGTLPPRPPAACVAVLVSGRYVVGDRAVRVSLEAVASSSTDGHPEEARTGDALDVDGLPADWVLRGIRAGDRLRTAGGRRKVQDLLVDRKVPRAARARLLVLAPGAGPDELLWVEGIGAAWDRRPHVATRRVLRLTVLTTNEDADGSE